VRIRTKIFLITGLVFSSLVLISSISMWTMNEISKLRKTTESGFELINRARLVHGLMKDLLFDMFTPQTYRLLKDVIHTPRFNTTLRDFREASTDFEAAFYEFTNSPRVLRLLRQEELRDAHQVAKIMSTKAFSRIAAFLNNVDRLVASGVLGEESLYRQLQAGDNAAIPAFFDEVRDTSYYLSNSFESYLNHFIRSLQKESEIIQRRILLLFWSLTFVIGSLTVVLSLLFARRISRQLQSVEEGFRKVSMGDFTVQLDIGGRDEFGTLAANFNLFLKDLKRNVDSVLSLLADVGRAISERFSLQEVFRLIVESAVSDSNADGAALLTFADSGRLLVRQTAGAFPLQVDRELSEEEGQLPAGQAGGRPNSLRQVLRAGTPLFLRDTQGAVLGQEAINSLLAIPLALPDRNLGVLCLVTLRPSGRFTDLDSTNFSTFADYAALILDNFFKHRELLEKRDAEYRALQAQIQPHFLYNLLNGLIGLNRMGERQALENAILSLKGMLRYTLEQNDWPTVAEELEFVGKYCELQQMRFQDRLSVSIECAEEAAGYHIPKLILQPLVENAIIHGIEPLGGPGRLEVTARLARRNGTSVLGISISDNGVGFTPDAALEGRHLGIANVKERLAVACPQAFLGIQSAPGGTHVRIEIAGDALRALGAPRAQRAQRAPDT
jgi:sensor histidine kinase YesM